MVLSGSSRAIPRVLFVEESPETIAANEQSLREAGLEFDAVSCHTKEEFQKRLLKQGFDVVVGSFGLPGWNALELLHWLYRTGIRSPYIMIMPPLDEATTEACLRAGAIGIVPRSDLYQLRIAFHRALKEQWLTTDREAATAQLVRSEEKFSKSFRLSPLASSIATLRGARFVEVNDAYIKMTGFSQEELIGKTSLELGIWTDPEQRTEMLQQLEWGNPVRGMETSMRNKAGEDRGVKLSAELIYLGSEPCILALLEDITETRRLEEQFRQAQKMEALGLLSGGIAHDFNNLLGVILGNVELVSEKIDQTNIIKKNLQQIRTAIEDGVGLCRDLLSFSRKRVSRPTDFDLNDLVRNLHIMLRRIIGENIALIIEFPVLPAYVKADRGLVNQAILNLIVNSRDAMPEGGRIVIKTASVEQSKNFSEVESGGSHVLLSLTDTGVGMDDRTKAEIFKPFFTTKSEGKGTGLGLVMVKGLMAQSGGKIEVESQLNQGTTVKLFFPRVETSVEQSPAGPEPSLPSRGKEMILLVEDNSTLLEAMASILGEAGYSVLPASDFNEAACLLRSQGEAIELILTDVVLPSGTGPQLVKGQTGVDSNKTKVLYMSGYLDHLGRLDATDSSPRLLMKPFSKQTLLKNVRSILDEGSHVEGPARSVQRTQGKLF